MFVLGGSPRQEPMFRTFARRGPAAKPRQTIDEPIERELRRPAHRVQVATRAFAKRVGGSSLVVEHVLENDEQVLADAERGAKKIRARWEELKTVTETFVVCCEEGNFSSLKEKSPVFGPKTQPPK